MTSNERKILECIWNHGGKAHVQHVAHRTKFSSGYSLSLCRSLEKAGHLEFINPNLCKLAEKGYGHFQDRAGIEVVATVASFLPQEESADDQALPSVLSDDEDDQSKEGGNTEAAREDQEAGSDPAVQQVDPVRNTPLQPSSETDLDKSFSGEVSHGVDYGAGEKRKDEDEGKTDSSPSSGDEGATRETEENVSGNDSKHEEGATERPSINPIGNIGLMIKRFVGSLKG